MVNNTKLLVVVSILIIISGLSLLWLGLRPIPNQSSLAPIPILETPQATFSATFGIEGEGVRVIEVVDGDTIRIAGNITVRLLGIDTPETKDPRKSVQCFGKEASNETKRLVGEKEVILEKDVSDKDKYGRLLRYVFLPIEDGPASRGEKLLFVNDYLIREGFARVLTYPPDVKYTEQFLEAQKKAKEEKRGLWGRC